MATLDFTPLMPCSAKRALTGPTGGERREEIRARAAERQGHLYRAPLRIAFPLGAPAFEVKDENVDATYDKGVLFVRWPKPADLQRPARPIEVMKARPYIDGVQPCKLQICARHSPWQALC